VLQATRRGTTKAVLEAWREENTKGTVEATRRCLAVAFLVDLAAAAEPDRPAWCLPGYELREDLRDDREHAPPH